MYSARAARARFLYTERLGALGGDGAPSTFVGRLAWGGVALSGATFRGVRLDTAEIAALTGGEVVGDVVVAEGATIDSRAVTPGALFVPVVAERDGHVFIAAAVEAGAGAYLTQQAPLDEVAAPAVRVVDTSAALSVLGSHVRDRIPTVIGVTGSVGKTSVKDLAAAALSVRHRTAASYRSFNNDLGVPLTLVNAPDDTEVAVIEMGARGYGHIARLCEVARPDIAVVTAVAHAHTELFGTIDDVAEAKAELVQALRGDGAAVLKETDERVKAMARHTSADVVTYGIDRGDVRVTELQLDGHLRPRFRLVTPEGVISLQLTVHGRHNAENAAAAVAVALLAGSSLDDAAEGLSRAQMSPFRMALHTTPSGAVVVNDAYNANPESMRAALRSLADLECERRIAVVGVMAELGDIAEDEHLAIARLAHDLGIELLAVDAPLYGVESVPDVDAAAERLGALGPGDAVLLKGSRVAGLERLADLLLAGAERGRAGARGLPSWRK